ncbi:MAG: DUF1905 domain-containing protein [Fimbriimonas sp.]
MESGEVSGWMTVDFCGEVWYWRGPAPFYFLKITGQSCDELREVMRSVTYGWGMIAVRARIGETEWVTSLTPKDGLYLLPLKDVVRRAEQIEEGHTVSGSLDVISAR